MVLALVLQVGLGMGWFPRDCSTTYPNGVCPDALFCVEGECTSCNGVADAASCAEYGCYWNGDACLDAPCNSLTDGDSCIAGGCYWDGAACVDNACAAATIGPDCDTFVPCQDGVTLTQDVVAQTPEQIAALSGVHCIVGNLEVSDYYDTTDVVLPDLIEVRGNATIGPVPFGRVRKDMTVSAPALERVSGDFIITQNGYMVAMGLPSLQQVGGEFHLFNNNSLLEFVVPGLAQPTWVWVFGNQYLERLDLGATYSEKVDVLAQQWLTELSLPGLVSGNLTVQGNVRMERIRADNYATSGHLGILRNRALTDVAFPALRQLRSWSIQENTQLPLCRIDALREQLDAPPEFEWVWDNAGDAVCE